MLGPCFAAPPSPNPTLPASSRVGECRAVRRWRRSRADRMRLPSRMRRQYRAAATPVDDARSRRLTVSRGPSHGSRPSRRGSCNVGRRVDVDAVRVSHTDQRFEVSAILRSSSVSKVYSRSTMLPLTWISPTSPASTTHRFRSGRIRRSSAVAGPTVIGPVRRAPVGQPHPTCARTSGPRARRIITRSGLPPRTLSRSPGRGDVPEPPAAYGHWRRRRRRIRGR
jgi:hypothetical protein